MSNVVAEIEKGGKAVAVSFPYSPEYVEAIKRVTSRRFIDRKKSADGRPYWRVDLNLDTMRDLRKQFGDSLVLGENLIAWGHEAVREERNLKSLATAEDAELVNVPAELVEGFKGNGLRPYQKADIKFMSQGSVINANQPGSGKTVETICAAIEAEYAYGQNLVVAPVTSLESVWVSDITEVYETAGMELPEILTGDTPDKRRNAVARARELSEAGEPFWLVINPHMVRGKKERTDRGNNIVVMECPDLMMIEWDTFTLDEYHLMGLSNGKTQGNLGVKHIVKNSRPKLRWALSGTPMGGKPVKMFGALQFVDPDTFTSKWNWVNRWLTVVEGEYGKDIEGVNPELEEEFDEHLKQYLIRRTKREALPGLPPKQRIDVWCDMSAKQEEQYKQFRTQAEWRLEDAEEKYGRVSATNVLSEYTRLKQFASAYCEVEKVGYDYDNDRDIIHVKPTKHSGKLEQLMEKLAEENVLSDDEPKTAIIFSQFREMVDMVAAHLADKGIEVAKITSDTKPSHRTAIVKAFQSDKPVKIGAEVIPVPRVVLISTKAGGTAITLSRADSVHVLDETWVPDDQEQAEDRAHRGDDFTMGRDEVRIYYYRTRRTIEEYIAQMVADKQEININILDLRRMGREEVPSGT